MDNYYVYILKSEINRRYYVGATSDLKRRLKYHNDGKIKSTKSGIPWILRYYERYSVLSKARIREQQIKRWKSRNMIEKLMARSSSPV